MFILGNSNAQSSSSERSDSWQSQIEIIHYYRSQYQNFNQVIYVNGKLKRGNRFAFGNFQRGVPLKKIQSMYSLGRFSGCP